MVQVRHVIVCMRAAGSASGAGWDLYLGAEEDGTRSLGAEDGSYPWVRGGRDPVPG